MLIEENVQASRNVPCLTTCIKCIGLSIQIDLLHQERLQDICLRRASVMTPAEVLRFASENGVKMVDLKFVDVPGMWQHFTVPVRELEEETFVEGKAFD